MLAEGRGVQRAQYPAATPTKDPQGGLPQTAVSWALGNVEGHLRLLSVGSESIFHHLRAQL